MKSDSFASIDNFGRFLKGVAGLAEGQESTATG
jgi:hypothetical protein